MALRTRNRIAYPKDRSLSYSVNEVWNSSNQAAELLDTNQAQNINTEKYRVIYEEETYLNQGGIHFVEANIPARFLIKSVEVLISYSGDYAAEFVAGSDRILLNNNQIRELDGLDNVAVDIPELAESITDDETVLRVEVTASGATSDSYMYVEVIGYQL